MTDTRSARRRLFRDDPEAVAARARVITMIDAIEPEHLVASIKRAPSLRGMILGYIAEQMFEIHVPDRYNLILAEHIAHHDDHDRTANKSDRTITFAGRTYGVQLKSIQTNSITRNLTSGLIEACVQNDASDRRDVVLEDGRTITTTCYLHGEYDILAVPLFPFTGKWDFAYKLNSNCAASTSRKYDAYTQSYLLSTLERITWPLSPDWHTNLLDLLTPENGSPIGSPDIVAEPGGEVRVSEAGAVILPDEDQEV